MSHLVFFLRSVGLLDVVSCVLLRLIARPLEDAWAEEFHPSAA